MLRTIWEASMVLALLAVGVREFQRLFAFNGECKVKERLRDAETELELSRAKLEEAGLVRRMR